MQNIHSATQQIFEPLSIRLHNLLLLRSPQQVRFWFGSSLLVAILYGLWGIAPIWRSPYIINDDARQHVFWMERFLDPTLFPQDLIANYFQSVAPWGYTHFYHLFAGMGLSPLGFSRVLPLIIGVIATLYGFKVCRQLLPIPFAGFVAALLLNQLFWAHDDLASATPRAFMPLFFLMFLYYLMRRKRWLCSGTIVLEGLFYPHYVLVFAGILCCQLVQWRQGRFRLAPPADIQFCLTGVTTACLVLLPSLHLYSDYGPVISGAIAKQLPDFSAEGDTRFFLSEPFLFWLTANRSGILPTLKPPLIGIGLLLPVLLGSSHRFRLAKDITPHLGVLWRIILTAFTLFFAAHLCLFKLHLPSRYTAYTLRFVLVFAAALSLTLLLEAGLRWLQQSTKSSRRILVWTLTTCLGGILMLYPLYADRFPNTGYEQGKAIELYEYLAQQPKDSLVASLLPEADNIPTFAQRSVLVAPEYAVPYHIGYAEPFRQRAQELIQAQYTLEPAVLQQFIQRYGIDFWLIDRQSFNPASFPGQWIRQYPEALDAARMNLQEGRPIVQQRGKQCTVLKSQDWRLLKADCLLRPQSTPQNNRLTRTEDGGSASA